MNRFIQSTSQSKVPTNIMSSQSSYRLIETNDEQKKHKQMVNNKLVLLAYKELGDLKTKHAAVIDTKEGNSTRACIAKGFQVHNIYAINIEKDNLPSLGNVKVPYTFKYFLEALGRRKLDFVFYDGTSTLAKIYKDIYHIIEKLSNKAVVGVTMSVRGRKDTDPGKFESKYRLDDSCWFQCDNDESWNEYYLTQVIRWYATKHNFIAKRVMLFDRVVIKRGIIFQSWIFEKKS